MAIVAFVEKKVINTTKNGLTFGAQKWWNSQV